MGKNAFTLRLKRKLYPFRSHTACIRLPPPVAKATIAGNAPGPPKPMLSKLLTRQYVGFTWISFFNEVYYVSAPDALISYADLLEPPSPFLTAHIPNVPHFYFNFLDRYLGGEIPSLLMAKLWDNPTILYDSSAIDKFVAITDCSRGAIGNWPLASHWTQAHKPPMDSCIAYASKDPKKNFCTFKKTCRCATRDVPSIIALLNCPAT